MSYDVYLGTPRCPTCGSYSSEVEIGNYTSNVSGMWTDALGRHLKDLEAMEPAEAIALLDAAVEKLNDPANYDKYKAMEPPNGWGDYQGAVEYLTRILTQWRAHPWMRIIVSH